MNLIHINDAPAGRSAQSYDRRLTPREEQVLALVSLPNAEIARLLGIAVATVRSILYDGIFPKIGAETRAQAAIWYERQRQGESDMERARRAA